MRTPQRAAPYGERAPRHAFSFSGPLLEAYLTQTGVGHITILQFGSAVVACLLAGLAWVMLKKTPASDLLLLSAAVAAGFSQAVVPFASHPTTLDPRWIELAAAIAHRLALSVWLGGLPALILLIGVGTIGEDTVTAKYRSTRHIAMIVTGPSARTARKNRRSAGRIVRFSRCRCRPRNGNPCSSRCRRPACRRQPACRAEGSGPADM